MTINQTLKHLKPLCIGPWGQRIYAQLVFGRELTKHIHPRGAALLLKIAQNLLKSSVDRSYISPEAAQSAEAALGPLSNHAKKITAHAVGHAHIDMNWMWRYDETVNITLETFRTVLNLMEDFPGFTFSQSQASCYRMVERFDKALLEKISAKVRENRWEVTAASWVEADKNMPSGESLARHILYTKQYMNRLFGLPEEALRLGFEPDTFGHSAQVPGILAAAGIEFYYFCRGRNLGSGQKNGPDIFNWKAPSGQSVLAYHEPYWYIKTIEPEFFIGMPEFCAKNGVADMLMVYGVGDHGGGPTRKDLKQLVDMMGWPLFPRIMFSTYHRYFDSIKHKTFPTEEGELNFIFGGCYTSQSRIKAANRIGEAALFEAEALTALSGSGDTALLTEGWQNLLFNQFHDIITGSCTPDAKEHAMGLFQDTLALANSKKSIAAYAIADMVDTSAIGHADFDASTSEGAGVGYKVAQGHGIGQAERGRGLRRGYLLFNMAQGRASTAEFTLWDWPGDIAGLSITDSKGNPLPFQVLEGPAEYWGHKRIDIAVYCQLPQMGWKLVIVDEKDYEVDPVAFYYNDRVDNPHEYVLENENLQAEIDPCTGTIKYLTGKGSNQTLTLNAGFFGLTESTNATMTSWRTARHKNDQSPIIAEEIKWLHNGPIRQAIEVTGRYKASKVSYVLSLDKGAEYLTFSTSVDWLETGSPEKGIPKLIFAADYTAKNFLYDISFGHISRPQVDFDMPGQNYVCALGKPALAIISKDKYGYRCCGDTVSLTLIRSSYDPDPYPELGRHNFIFHLAIPQEATPAYMGGLAAGLRHPVFSQSVPGHKGSLPPEYSMLAVGGAVSCVKLAEDGTGDIIIRVYDDIGEARKIPISLPGGIAKASLCTLTEKILTPLTVSKNTVQVPLKKNGVATVRLQV
ncbi:MAG: glycosyl hydrolase-related protein [Defluviitaleaceae bacterium]|nr:glycosyl hydrolase-related protein [Defluviitaleaceae bacterium]